jgi:MoxR-like ATPase
LESRKHVQPHYQLQRPYRYIGIEDFSAESAFSKETIELWFSRLKRKKHLIFQGPPGTGKTYVAERLAKLLTATRMA